MKQPARPWSFEDDTELRSLALAGLSEAEIGERIGRNKSSVRSRTAKLQIAIARDQNGIHKIALVNKLFSRKEF